MEQFCALIERVALLEQFLAISREKRRKNDRRLFAFADEPRKMHECVVGVR
jgi:hypothetical protein